MLVFLASVCIEPKGTHLHDRKALGKIKCAVSVRLLPAVNKKTLFLARLYLRNNKTPYNYSYSHKRIQWEKTSHRDTTARDAAIMRALLPA